MSPASRVSVQHQQNQFTDVPAMQEDRSQHSTSFQLSGNVYHTCHQRSVGQTGIEHQIYTSMDAKNGGEGLEWIVVK